MNPGVPTIIPVCVRGAPATANEMPKSMTRGPSLASSTFEGLRSRCTTPAAWIASSASASAPPSARTDASGQGPCAVTAPSSGSPATYAVASHGGVPSGSASTTPAVKKPLTRRAASTSRAKRLRNCGSSASSARTTFTATGRPPGDRARNTRPMPPAPSRASTW